MPDICQRCGKVGYDRRTLWMKCLYAMDELPIPFSKKEDFFTLLVCKKCRGDWLVAIGEWFTISPVKKDPIGSGIFVRRNGATVEISEEEWYRDNPNREPVRFKEICMVVTGYEY